MKKPGFKMRVRHWTALSSAFIYNLNVFGLSARGICAPGFNCHGCKWATFACPVGIAGYGFGIRQIPTFMLGTLIAIGLVFGRLVCAYACPVGLVQEGLYRIPSPKPRLPKFLRYGKYLTLFLLVFGLTWIFGFEPKTGYIKISKPRIDKIVSSEVGTLSEKPTDTDKGKTYCPVPEGMLGNTGVKKIPGLLNRLNQNKSQIKPQTTPKPDAGNTVKPEKKSSLAPPSFKPFALNRQTMPKSVKPQTPPTGVTPPVKPKFGLQNFKTTGKPNNDAQTGSAKKTMLAQKFPGFGTINTDKPAADGKSMLKVEIDIENVSPLPVDGFSFTATYYSNKDKKKILWKDEKPRVYSNTVAPGEKLTVPAFVIPYMIDKAELVITSPESKVKLDYWPLFCTYCPVAVVEADLPAEISNSASLEQMFYATTRMNLPRLLIALAVLVLCIMFTRFFCRVLCPLGAMYAILSKFSLYRIEVHHEKCISCSMIAGSNACTRCDADCPVGLDVFTEAGSAECIACGNCLKACPKGAIVSKFKL